MPVVLKIQEGKTESSIPVRGLRELVLGRGDKSNVRLKDELASRLHCRLVLTPQGLEIQDLNSKNGTYLNGIKVFRSDFFIGDVVKIGETKISLESDSEEDTLVRRLTFRGPLQQRMAHELRVDFTSILASLIDSRGLVAPQARPVPIRPRLAPPGRQVQSATKTKLMLASVIDILALVFAVLLPALISKIVGEDSFTPKTQLSLGLGLACAYCVFNFHIWQRSLGERWTEDNSEDSF